MQEGTSSQNSGITGTSGGQAPWQIPQTVYPGQPMTTPIQPSVPTAESTKPNFMNPVVYRADNGNLSGDGVKKARNFPIKKILAVLLAIFVSLTLLAIIFSMFKSGGSSVTNEEVSLIYWGIFEDENIVRPVIAEFEKENPNIKIKYEKQDLTDYKKRLIARTQNEKGPDIFRYHNTWYPAISGILLPLPSEVVEKSDFNSKYYNVAGDDLVKNGIIYGIPLYADTLSLFINNDLFTSTQSGSSLPAPKTWQEFINTATFLTKRDGNGAIEIGGAGIGTYDNVNHAPDIISLLLAQNGVDLNNPSKNQEKITDAIRFYTNFSRVENNVWDSTQDNTLLAFSQGKLAMYFGYSWDYFEIKAKNPNIKMTVAPVPQLITDDPINIANYWVEGVSAKTANPKEALLFMEFLAKGETQEKFFQEASKTRDFGEPYSIIAFADKLKDSAAYTFVSQSKSAISSPFVDVTGDESELNDFLKKAVDDISKSGSDESAIEDLLGGYSKVVGNINLGN
jgi:ABC-type glycerol-3-phosphate transport system substrate-binding protein